MKIKGYLEYDEHGEYIIKTKDGYFNLSVALDDILYSNKMKEIKFGIVTDSDFIFFQRGSIILRKTNLGVYDRYIDDGKMEFNIDDILFNNAEQIVTVTLESEAIEEDYYEQFYTSH